MSSLLQINEELDALHLLRHPFYQSWSAGSLDVDVLKRYACEYYHHVSAFPCYVSGVHSRCRGDLAARRVLLANLSEEENESEPHPELWADFARALGCSSDDLAAEPVLRETESLVDGYFKLVSDGYEDGLGALYAYERQTPSVSVSKMDGLRKFYGITSSEALRFFEVHVRADEWHARECGDLIERLSPEGKERARKGAVSGARLLWQFLDGMMRFVGLSSPLPPAHSGSPCASSR